MKKIVLCLVVASLAMGAMGQKSHYFEYDRNLVSAMVESINETTVTADFSYLPLGDTANPSVKSRSHYFWIGALGGGLGFLAGMGIGYLGGELLGWGTAFGCTSIVVGPLVGIIVPQAVVSKRTPDPGSTKSALFGGAAAVTLGAVGLVAVFLIGDLVAGVVL